MPGVSSNLPVHMKPLCWVCVVVLAGCASTTSTPPPVDAGGICATTPDCPLGQQCRGGVCSTAQCSTREDCVTGAVCRDTVCTSPDPAGACSSLDHCPTPQVCDGFQRRCVLGDGGIPNPVDAGSGTDASVSLGAWHVDNEADPLMVLAGPFPAAVHAQPGDIVIMARASGIRDFEAHFNVALGPNVRFCQSTDPFSDFPVINGGEVLSLYNGMTRVDGPSITGMAVQSIQRINARVASDPTAWEVGVQDNATPGTTRLTMQDRGVFISEWSDATPGAYEFVEIFYNP